MTGRRELANPGSTTPASGGSDLVANFILLLAWQRPLEDVGAQGKDKGRGGKYLILPPGYRGNIPDFATDVGITRKQSQRWQLQASVPHGRHFTIRGQL